MACKDYHDHGPDEGFRRVLDYEGGDWNVAEDGTVSQDAFAYHISLACNHCASPACTQVCPTGAMHRDETGLIWPDGCRERLAAGQAPICVEACPLRALDFGEKGDIFERHAEWWDEVRGDILPLPSETETGPNLFIRPCPAAAQGRKGALVNRKEIGL